MVESIKLKLDDKQTVEVKKEDLDIFWDGKVIVRWRNPVGVFVNFDQKFIPPCWITEAIATFCSIK